MNEIETVKGVRGRWHPGEAVVEVHYFVAEGDCSEVTLYNIADEVVNQVDDSVKVQFTKTDVCEWVKPDENGMI